jgi:mannose-6-phosphate isomerase-like protein (cupin superfamily)
LNYRYDQVARTQEGHFRVLENFSRRSSLLKGIEKYRVAILETEPRAFAMPSHIDADELFYVISGNQF